MKKIAGILSALLLITSVQVAPVFAEETGTSAAMEQNVLNDAAAIDDGFQSAEAVATETNKFFFEDDLSVDNGQWTMSGGFVIDEETGTLKQTVPSEQSKAIAIYSLSGYDFQHDWNIRFKAKFSASTKKDILMIHYHGGKRAYITMRLEKQQLSIENVTTAVMGVAYDTWYEFLFQYRSYDGKPGVSVYRRKVGESNWQTLMTDKLLDARNFGSETIELHIAYADTPGHSFDDFMVYQGTYATFEEPVIADGAVTTAGKIVYDMPSHTQKRHVQLMAAVYNKEHGYVEEVHRKEMVLEPGATLSLNDSFQLTGYDAEKHDVATMVWHTIKDGIPLAAATGTGLTNTSESAPEQDQEPAIAAKVSYNEVILEGYTGAPNESVTASLSYLDEPTGEEELAAISEVKANSRGMITTKIAVNPSQKTGNYALRVRYGNRVAEESVVRLVCNDSIPAQIETANDLESFITNFGDEKAKAWLEKDGVIPYIYESFAEKASVDDYADIYKFRAELETAGKIGNDQFDLITKLNQAVVSKKWADAEMLVMTTYRDLLSMDEISFDGVMNKKDLFLRLKGGYTTVDEIIADIKLAVIEQRNADAVVNNGQGVIVGGSPMIGGGGASFGGGASGGGGYSSKGAVSVDIKDVPEDVTEVAPELDIVENFSDLDGYSWAEKSIRELQLLDLIQGVGDGKFAPERVVTREEFLKMAMSAMGIPVVDTTDEIFEDVSKDMWYAPYVMTAYQNGIVQGVSAERFGIGEEITRADMAVMLDRILKHCNVDIKATRPAFLFEDSAMIPIYAQDSISELCRAELLNGMGDNYFMPDASATRAEAAVAIYRLYQYTEKG